MTRTLFFPSQGVDAKGRLSRRVNFAALGAIAVANAAAWVMLIVTFCQMCELAFTRNYMMGSAIATFAATYLALCLLCR